MIPVVGLAVALAGCTQPAVAPKAPAFQERENKVRDWAAVGRAIADSMADRRLLTARTMHPQPAATSPVPPGRYYVNLIRPGIPFLREVGDALKTEILTRGSAVSTTPADSMVVNVDVSSVRWGRDVPPTGGFLSLAGLTAGAATVLGANGPYTPADGFGMAAGLGIALDVIKSLSPETNVEAVWKATIIRNDTYMMEASAPVYVRASDLWMYRGDDTNRLMASYEPPAQRTLVQLRYAQ